MIDLRRRISKITPPAPPLPDLSDAMTWAGVVLVAIGVGLVHIPAGIITAGLILLFFAWVLDNSTPGGA